MSGRQSDWHRGSELNNAVKEFHDRYAREPKSEMTEAKRLHQLYIEELRRRLADGGVCSRLEYTGSAYEGVKVRRKDNDSDLEFDIMVILRGGAELEVEPYPGKPGYVKLLLAQTSDTQQTNEFIRKAIGKNNLLSAGGLANKFMGKLQQCLKQCQEDAAARRNVGELTDDELEQLRHINDRVKLRRHGSAAVQMDVKTASLKPFYSVDMVPTIQIDDDYYVAKPIKGASGGQIAWRRSFSLQEKERLLTLDDDNGCRKQVLRVLKVIRYRDGGVGQLTSYHLKTMLFRMADRLSAEAQWKSDCLGERLMDVIGQFEQELSRGVMPNYFLPRVNLLDGKKQGCIVNIQGRMKNLRNSERKMMKLLQIENEIRAK